MGKIQIVSSRLSLLADAVVSNPYFFFYIGPEVPIHPWSHSLILPSQAISLRTFMTLILGIYICEQMSITPLPREETYDRPK